MSTVHDVHDQLDTDYAPAWQPAEGDKIIGTVTDVTERDGTYGRYPIVTVRAEGGDELAIHAFHEVLQSELAKVAPKPGDDIGVKYLGKHEERGYHRYRVARAGGTATVAWSDYQGAAGAEPEAADPWRVTCPPTTLASTPRRLMPTTSSRSRPVSEDAAASDMLAAALGYAARDWPVFPCAGKVPRTLHGCKDASTDPSHVGEWWGRWPAADVAVATGDGLLVADVDGQAGADTLYDLERAYDELPQTICATTGGGGMHYYFAAPCGYRSSAGALGPGLDIRAAGGYVIAPPSSHRSGGRYVWDLAPEDTKLALAPGWLLTLAWAS